jgi:23S rRNA (cytidine1920-2'-O)/16S rRNA (cytidine1409-2'-O)-methyltransferase
VRIDQLLVQRGLPQHPLAGPAPDCRGCEWLQGEVAARRQKRRRGARDAQVRLLDDAEARYVSRGGLKLEAALKHVGLSVAGLACLDVGQSTGGFTDCLLQHGARMVVGVSMWAVAVAPALREDHACCAWKVSTPVHSML